MYKRQSLNVVPAEHAPHRVSAEAVHAAVWPCPAGHVAHASHAVLSSASLNVVPAEHAPHRVSAEAVHAAVWPCPAGHVVHAAHSRFRARPAGPVVEQALVSYCVAVHAVHVAHCRSLPAPPPLHARVSYCVAEHVEHAVQLLLISKSSAPHGGKHV